MINKVINSFSFLEINLDDLFFITVKIFNNKMQQILNDIKSLPIIETSVNEIEQTISTDVTSSIYHVEFFYDMQAKNFGAEKVRNIF